MCGVVGFLGRNRPSEQSTLEAMVRTLHHRGPDAQTTFQDAEAGLGHARLSIIDLAGGSQPVFNEDHTLACVLNGEIYNYRELRAKLVERGHRFASHSDTEVIVHLYEDHGVQAFSHLEGMFAIIVVDLVKREMVVARDRMGEKPLYFVDTPGYFACASELRALKPLSGWRRTISESALASYLRYGYVTGGDSIYEGARKLLPGHFLVVNRSGVDDHTYWAPRLRPDASRSRGEWHESLRDVLRESMRNKLVADVPVGVFLSGGLDSSSVVALASEVASGSLKTFSVRFGDNINELPLARQVAARYGTDHTELDINTGVADAVSEVVPHYDEPFADSSAVPTYLISKAARSHVKVVLTGDGGDEVFGGYESYLSQRRYSSIAPIRKLAGLVHRIPILGPRLIDAAYPLPAGAASSLRAWQAVRGLFTAEEVNALLGRPARAALDADLPPTRELASGPLDQALLWDLLRYLPDDLLCKVDRASMACGLETRAPLLDYRLVEYALTIPAIEKVRGNTTKSLFRETVAPWLPAAVTHGEKQGFGAPLKAWLSADLRDLVAKTFAHPVSASFVDQRVLTNMVDQAKRTLSTNWRSPLRLWALLMLELWARRR